MKYSIRLTKKDYTKFERAYNKKIPFTCKGFNIELIVCSSDTDLFSISSKDKETFIKIEKIEQSYFGTTTVVGYNCIITIQGYNPLDVTTKDSGFFGKPPKVEKTFSFTVKWQLLKANNLEKWAINLF